MDRKNVDPLDPDSTPPVSCGGDEPLGLKISESSNGEEVEFFSEDQEEMEEHEVDDDQEEDELPPMLELPSTGYLHSVDEDRPPPFLEPAVELSDGMEKDEGDNGDDPEVVEIWESDPERSSTTDSDDELVKVDYCENPPLKFRNLLRKYRFVNKKDGWMYAVRSFYQKQPSKLRRMLKMHKDAKGNPVEEPIGMLFEKWHAERERIRRLRGIKTEEEKEEEEGPTRAVSVMVSSSDPRLVHVAYPANVVNDDKAVATLGGIGTISKTLNQPNKKLMLKFRPNDPFANGVNAVGRTACGLLLRVRRRKNVSKSQQQQKTESGNSQKINLDTLGDEPLRVEDIHDLLLDNQLHVQCNEHYRVPAKTVILNGKEYHKQDLLLEDKIVLDAAEKRSKERKAWRTGGTKDYNLQVPETLEAIEDPNLRVNALGIVHRSYEFNGICDFQYLPVMKKSDGNIVSIKDRIFPILGFKDNTEKLVSKDFVNDKSPCQTFILPPAMSRIDNPPRGLIDELITSDKADVASKKHPPDDSVFSSRMKRIIYTISYNFQVDGNVPAEEVDIPTQPLSLAWKDIERRQIGKELIEKVRQKFEERPIWSKAALESDTKIPAPTLKYIIPYFAYFAANGPWRNTWIKFSVDPRKCFRHVIYQSIDFRVPFIYRRFMDVGPKNPEAAHKFLPECVPPKTQMFYQLCDIELNEMKELTQTLYKRADAGRLSYDERFGFLKEGTYEYFRYILTYYLENLLQEYGKIPASANTEVTFRIPPGEIEPTSKVKAAPHRRVKVKRIRKSTKKVVEPHGSTTPRAKRGKSKSTPMPKTSEINRYNQKALEDLALNDLPDDSDNEGADDMFEPEDDYTD